MAFDIDSPTNDRVKRLVRLRDRRHRDAENLFVVEGEREMRRAIDSGHLPLEIYGDGSKLPDHGERRWSCSPQALAKASYRSSPQTVIGVFEKFTTDLDSVDLKSPALVLVIEGLEKPGNLGAVLRTADAFGADVVIGLGATVDLFNPNVIRSSTGAVFDVPYVGADLELAGGWLRARGITLVGASLSAEREPWELDLSGPTALMVGTEDEGLSPEALNRSHVATRIPMSGIVDSLNTSITMALLVYETVRQRST